jgi:FkbM family methyltransferase
VGANVGVAAAFFAAECGAGCVHCFEPVPHLVELLRENVAQFEACVVHDYGLSSTDGRMTITYYPAAAAMSGLYADPEADSAIVRQCLLNLGLSEEDADAEVRGRYQPVKLECELRTLSRALREEAIEGVDLLKIDVERAELDVLIGIADPDWDRIRQVAAEVHDEGGRLATVAGILEDRGFDVVTDQDPVMNGTPVHMVYARRR